MTGIESLTPVERRVADLAASGHGNREIAQRYRFAPPVSEAVQADRGT